MPEPTAKLIEEVKEIIGITSRVDERVKNIAESQQQMNSRLNRFIDEHNALTSRVHVLEAKNGHKFQEMVIAQDEKVVRLSARLDMIETMGSPKEHEMKHELVQIKSGLKELEAHKQTALDRVRSIFGFVSQGIFYIILYYLLYRLGLNNTPLVP